MIRSLKTDTVFSPEQVSLRNAIGERLSAGLASSNGNPAFAGKFFLFPSGGLLQIANAEAQLPGWLFADYRAIYEQKTPQSDHC